MLLLTAVIVTGDDSIAQIGVAYHSSVTQHSIVSIRSYASTTIHTVQIRAAVIVYRHSTAQAIVSRSGYSTLPLLLGHQLLPLLRR